MVKHEPWKASAPEVYLLRTTDGSVPRGLDPITLPNDILRSTTQLSLEVDY